MFTKLKTRVNEIKNDPFYQGAAVATIGGMIGAYGAVIYAKKTGMILTPDDLNIPDVLVKHIQETGLPVLIAHRVTGAQLTIGLS